MIPTWEVHFYAYLNHYQDKKYGYNVPLWRFRVFAPRAFVRWSYHLIHCSHNCHCCSQLRICYRMSFHPCMTLQHRLGPSHRRKVPPVFLSPPCLLQPHIPRISLQPYNPLFITPAKASLRFYGHKLFFYGVRLSVTCQIPNLEDQRILFSSGSSPLTCPAWETLPVAMLPLA
jgi:hypothetical protein